MVASCLLWASSRNGPARYHQLLICYQFVLMLDSVMVVRRGTEAVRWPSCGERPPRFDCCHGRRRTVSTRMQAMKRAEPGANGGAGPRAMDVAATILADEGLGVMLAAPLKRCCSIRRTYFCSVPSRRCTAA